MVELATGQQLAEQFGAKPLTPEEILTGSGDGANLSGLTPELKKQLVAATPLWFYVLREAEVNGGKLNAVGGRLVAEVFHRTMEASAISILREPGWSPTLGRGPGSFEMIDLLLVATDGKIENLNPLGD